MRVQPFAHLLFATLLAAQRGVTASCSSWSTRYQQDIDGVCVCNATNCDSVSTEYLSLSNSQVGLFQTSKAGNRLAYSTLEIDDASDDTADLSIDSAAKYQEIIGFGGAFTDAAAINIYLMDSDVQRLIVDAYFSDTGLQYSLGRIPIASTDFSEYVYSYNPSVDDFEMSNFSIDVDKEPLSNKLSLIQRALNETSAASRNLTLFASSWAPPVWMTTSNTTLNCEMNGYPGGEYWEALALYYSKFIDVYEAEGVPIWGLTTQNEPTKQELATKFWQSLRFNTTTERGFIKRDLGPLMEENHPDLKIIILDDQKDLLLDWDASLLDEEARRYVSGVGVHWYKNLDFAFGTSGDFDDLVAFHDEYPDIFILATEACEGSLVKGLGTGEGTDLFTYSNNTWQRGENYARDIINDLASFASGWTDWNLVLNTTGGPNWADNQVDAPILVDEEGGRGVLQAAHVLRHGPLFQVPRPGLAPGPVEREQRRELHLGKCRSRGIPDAKGPIGCRAIQPRQSRKEHSHESPGRRACSDGGTPAECRADPALPCPRKWRVPGQRDLGFGQQQLRSFRGVLTDREGCCSIDTKRTRSLSIIGTVYARTQF